MWWAFSLMRVRHAASGYSRIQIGLALSLNLELHVTLDGQDNQCPQNCKITYEGLGKEEISLDADRNLITRTALYRNPGFRCLVSFVIAMSCDVTASGIFRSGPMSTSSMRSLSGGDSGLQEPPWWLVLLLPAI
jgi:hypothetical protein